MGLWKIMPLLCNQFYSHEDNSHTEQMTWIAYHALEISNTKMGKNRQGGQRMEITLLLCQQVQS